MLKGNLSLFQRQQGQLVIGGVANAGSIFPQMQVFFVVQQILETYSIYTVDDIRTRLKKLDSLLELNSDFNYTITTDENDIRQRKRVDLMGLLMIHENLNYFSRLYKN